MRLFLVIMPPKDFRDLVRDDLRIIKKRLDKNLTYIPVDQLHLTIKYLGDDVSNDSMQKLTEELQARRSLLEPVEINIEDFNFGFRFQSNPRILKYDVEQTEGLNTIINTVHETAKITGLRDVVRFKQKVDYHITAAKLRNTASKKVVKELRQVVDEINNKRKLDYKFKATQCFLMESTTTRTGVVYKVHEEFDMG